VAEITEQDVRQAETDARDAQRAYLDVQRRALEDPPETRPSGAEVVSAQREAQLAELRIEIVKRRAAESAEAERRRQLAELGSRVEQFYAETAASRTIAVLAQCVSEAVANFHAGIATHNQRVARFNQEAAALGTRPGNRGPRPEDSYVLRTDGIRSRHLEVRPVGSNAESYAMGHLVAGRGEQAMAELRVTHDHTPQPPATLWIDRQGILPPQPGPVQRDMQSLIGEGRLVQATPEQLAAWWERQAK
jgi:hypothetical protein